MKKNLAVALLLTLSGLAACARTGQGIVPAGLTADQSRRTAAGGVVQGNFTEYALPSGANPSDFTRGPYDTLWFHSPPNLGYSATQVYRFTDSNGTVTTFSLPNPYFSWSSGIISTQGYIWYLVANRTTQNDESLVRITSAGAMTFFAGNMSDEPAFDIALGSDGRFWFPMCVESCGQTGFGDFVASINTAGVPGPAPRLPGFTATFLTPGPSGYIYASAVYSGGMSAPPHDSAVFVISTAGAILNTYYLPNGSDPSGIVTGSDKNLWITEPGINSIARMTTSGVVTQFPLPTANAGPNSITYGADGALWFTQTQANKIGRITTSGVITEYSIPTANSGASAILTCTTNCPPHGGVWFTETAANKIGKFTSPI